MHYLGLRWPSCAEGWYSGAILLTSMSAALYCLAVSIITWCSYNNFVLPQLAMIWAKSRSMVNIPIRDLSSGIFNSRQISGRLASVGGFGMGRKVSSLVVSVTFMALCFRKLQHIWRWDFVDQILQPFHIFCLHSFRCSGHHQLGIKLVNKFIL